MSTQIKDIASIRTQTKNILEKHNFYALNDIAEDIPRKYLDFRTLKEVQKCEEGDYAAISGVLTDLSQKTSHNNRDYLIGTIVQSDSQKITFLSFQNIYLYDHYIKLLQTEVVACGKITWSPLYGYSLSSPISLVSKDLFKPHIFPVHKKYAGISEKKMSEIRLLALEQAKEPLELEVCRRDNLPDYQECLHNLHYPKSASDITNAKYRLLYNDLLYLALKLEKEKDDTAIDAPIFTNTALCHQFASSLPFSLTSDQKAVLNAMFQHAKKGERNRILLQGDVGCGKTIVGAFMMVFAAENGYQSVFMAPRSVLAEQHFEELSKYAKQMGIECAFLHSGMKKKEREGILKDIASGKIKWIIGTHSCFSDDVIYSNLGLVITDEEHLFGVTQKQKLDQKAISGFHQISMTATPIPRTIAEALYGASKEILSIQTKPEGRKDIITQIETTDNVLYAKIEQELKKSHLCYVVCPAIEENEDNHLISLEETEKKYRKYFEPKGYAIGVVNGKQKKDIMADTVKRFAHGEYQILLSTTVIEVGVNVPDATVMVIEQAEQFGLASLHQLRGRVGRSDLQSYCYLHTEAEDNDRLQVMCKTNNGFVIAEEDLKQRGAGNLIGTEQSGFHKLINQMIAYPKLYEKIQETARFCIKNGYGENFIQARTEIES